MPAPLSALDAGGVRRWADRAATDLERHQDEINDLNVFPIPDRDTGTNMAMTARAASAAADVEAADDLHRVLSAMANGAVLGARGNSGVILAQLARGLADSAAGQQQWDGAAFAAGLVHAVDCAYAAVGDPTEGTILTVARAAADATTGVDGGLGAVVHAAAAASRTALAATTGQLEALRAAGVIDAGGRGLVVVLEALLDVVCGRSAQLPERVAQPPERAVAAAEPTARTPDQEAARATGPHRESSGEFGYEVRYLLDAGAAAVDLLRGELGELGDSLVVVGTDFGHWNVHVHVNDAGAAIEAGVRAGRPYQIEITRFADQQADARRSRPGVAIVVIGPGAGVADVFRGEGIAVVDAHAGSNPTVDDVLGAVRATGAGSVVLLSRAEHVADVAEPVAAQARDEGIAIAVVALRSAVQGLAAVAVHDPTRRFEDDVIRMAESAAATRWADVTVAAGESLTSAGRCQRGDALGMIAGEVVVIGSDVSAVAVDVIERLLGVGGELVTVLIGAGVPDGAAATIVSRLARTAPHIELDMVLGGQPDQPFLIGVE